jgi:methylglutaconyl-CoA hydratase
VSAKPPVRIEVADHVATLTLDRPEKRNALNAVLVEALSDALARTASDPAVHVVAIRGAGKDFCAGADLDELERTSRLSEAENLADVRRMGALFAALRAHPRPVVAVVTGHALAGGAGLATACDLVLAHEHAELGYPEVHLGFVPALVMTILRRKLPEAVAFELVAKGDRIGAREAERIGLARVIPSDGFDGAVARYLAELAGRPPSAVALTKALLYELGELDFEAGLERAAEVNVEARMTEACREGVRRFLERSASRA